MKILFTTLLLMTATVFAETKAQKNYSENVRFTIRSHFNEVKDCYDKNLKENPNEEGKIDVHFVLNDQGKVEESKINEQASTLKSPAVRTCVTELFKTWRFPRPAPGTVVEVDFPFILEKPKTTK